MSKWIREDGMVFTSSSNSQVDLSDPDIDLDELHRFFDQLEKETEEYEKEKYGTTNAVTETEQTNDPNRAGNRSESDPITRPKNNSERVKLGRPCEFSECTCGHKGCAIPLSSHSDWCDYRLWKESLIKKADEYSSGRIFF